MAMQDKAAILFGLGEVEHDARWPDYLEYGFIDDDLPMLLALVADKKLWQADVDSAEVWVPLHAWRVLGQLRNPAAIEPILMLLDDGLLEDIWAEEELPMAFAMMGRKDLAPLAAYLHEHKHSEDARTVVVDALSLLADSFDECRDSVVNVLMTCLMTPDNAAPELNGLIVCSLIDLHAVETLAVVRELYASGCVDVSYAGDLAAVEASFSAGPSSPKEESFGSIDDDGASLRNIFDEMDAYLVRYRHANSVQTSSELDGFFTALACAPNNMEAEQWLPMMFGGAETLPLWQTQEDEDLFSTTALVMYRQVIRALNNDTFSALFRRDELGKATIADDWCRGFMRGLATWGPMPKQDMAYLERNIKPMRLFTASRPGEKLKRVSGSELNQALDAIEANVRSLYQHWLKPRDKSTEPAYAGVRVGRNDPCHCGSGKKFKKCCLH